MNRIVFFIVFLLLFIACKKEQVELAELNRNCFRAIPVSADFVIEEPLLIPYWESIQIYIPTDTAYANKNMRFRALDTNSIYTWHLGSEVIHEHSFVRHFSEDFIDQSIEVTLVVKKKPNLICFPNDDGYDSTTRIIHFVKKNTDPFESNSHLFRGTFRLKDSLTQDADSVDVYMEYKPKSVVGGTVSKMEVFNLFGLGQTNIVGTSSSLYAYRYWWVQLDTKPYTFKIMHSMDGLVTILLEDIFNDDKPVHNFKGRKLN